MKYPNLYLTARMMTYSGGNWNGDFLANIEEAQYDESELQAAEDYCQSLTHAQREYLATPEDPETDDLCQHIIRGMAEDNPATPILNYLYGC